MKFLDLRHLDGDSPLVADVCIVGSGPVGLSIANELAGTSLEVLVLESGGLETEPATQTLYDIESTGVPRRLNQEKSRLRIFGGTSRIWSGRCGPLDVEDFDARSWVKYSGWPLTRAQMDPYFERAGVYLGLGPHCYDDSLWSRLKNPRPTPPLDESVLRPIFWQSSQSPIDSSRPVDFGRDLKFPNSPNIRVLLHANVLHINIHNDLSIFDSVDISTLDGKLGQVRAGALVLGCGGIENARLLLASNRLVPRGLGNQHDHVGRFLMDHPVCVVGRFDAANADRVRDRFGLYWLDDRQRRNLYLHGMTLSKEIQRKEHLLRCNAYIETFDVAEDDPWLALRRLGVALKSRRLRRGAIRDGKVLLTHPAELGRGLYRRLVKHRPRMTRAGRIELHCMLEQPPDPESRVTLSSDQKDALGMPLSRIHWKIGEVERLTVRRMAHLICQEFRRLKLPVPALSPWLDADDDWVSHFEEKAHPMGTTRLSADPKQGVVDVNLQVHDIAGLFVAGSSVFPTSGAVNPMLTTVALALRLADWLKTGYFKPH